ncbi:MAG: shikimate kinase [Oscillospiraceae bacterium]|jgi:shikimate kinase|nr:shikimate kinase [Oscillospiraceae bacterium]
MKKNIVLCGFMGSGKTTVGTLLAERLSARFFDTDQLIEQAMGFTVPEIFDKLGEPRFRAAETAAIRKLAEKSWFVAALGGGAICDHKNVRVLKKTGVLVYLRVSLATALRRISGGEGRPLALKGREETERLFWERQPVYEAAADIAINADGEAGQVAEEVLYALRERCGSEITLKGEERA